MTVQSKKYLDDILFAIELIEEFVEGVNSFIDYKKTPFTFKGRSPIKTQINHAILTRFF